MNLNIWGDFQICISVPLREVSPFHITSLIVHISDVNSCEYVLAILKGKGLKDYDIIIQKVKVKIKKVKQIVTAIQMLCFYSLNV